MLSQIHLIMRAFLKKHHVHLDLGSVFTFSQTAGASAFPVALSLSFIIYITLYAEYHGT